MCTLWKFKFVSKKQPGDWNCYLDWELQLVKRLLTALELNTKTLKALGVTFPELREVVANNDKQRYSMILASALDNIPSPDAASTPQDEPQSDDPSDYLIRANQGHSIKVDTDGLLTPIAQEAGNIPDTVIHGTDEPAWNLILKSGGLRRMGRNHIHFASGLPAGFKSLTSSTGSAEEKDAAPVISGMRKNSSILIYIDIQAAIAAGIKFFISENGVILTEGNEQGFLPYEFFKRVESRKASGGVLMSDGQLPEGVVVDVEAWEKEIAEGQGKGKRGGRAGGRGGGRGGKAKAVDDSRDLMAGV
ncbi:hypothetical protein NX059_002359 [Plenodomus lindquistii]|nr:hypothetical protein NX059_002359 [Plenodomus lindquistii]